ncbi:MAG: AEC family transporter, partial [Rhodospirillales bacterium]|nr:AEC family transporter [Rhodospirillales bacterium]
MHAILTVAFPIFALIGIGWIAGRRNMLGVNGTGALNGFVTWFALPAMLFMALAKVRLSEILNGPFAIVFGGSMLATFVVGMAMARLMSRAGLAHMSLHGLAACFGNVGYMGIPLCIAAFGPAGALPGTLAACMGAAGMLTFGLIVVEFGQQRGYGFLSTLARVGKSVLRSPIVQAVGLGLIASGFSIPIPDPVQRFLDLLASAAGPCALFAIGHFLSDKGLPRSLREVGVATAGKIVLQPLLALALLPWFLDLDSMWGKAAILLAALPSAANCFVLAKEYDTFVEEASATVLL